MRKDNKKILLVAQDPGGFNSIINVIKKLRKFEVKVLLAGESRKAARKNKIKYIDCEEKSKKNIEKILNKFNPNLVFTATSMGMSLEKKVINWSKKNEVKSVSIIDFWSNYKMRFSNIGKTDLKYMPDLICVIDEYMKGRMLEQGFDKRKLIITGNPLFDNIKQAEKIKENYILFVSQPFTEVFSKADKKNTDSAFFNEVNIFSDYIKAIKKAEVNLPMIISFHPREKKKDKFNKIIDKSKLKIKITDKDTMSLFSGAKLVVGINTMVLFQAVLAGKKVISYQPGIKKEKDPLISNRLGLSVPVYSRNKLIEIFKNGATADKTNKKLINKYIKNNSTKKVLNIINKI